MVFMPPLVFTQRSASCDECPGVVGSANKLVCLWVWCAVVHVVVCVGVGVWGVGRGMADTCSLALSYATLPLNAMSRPVSPPSPLSYTTVAADGRVLLVITLMGLQYREAHVKYCRLSILTHTTMRHSYCGQL